jgi:polysaccharide biosynthesis protein PslE
MKMPSIQEPVVLHESTSMMRDALTILFKHRHKIMAVFLGCVALALAMAFLMTPVYEAYTSALVKIGRETMYRTEIGEDRLNKSTVSIDAKAIVPSEVAILSSQDVIRRTIHTLGVDRIYPKIVADPPANMSVMDAAILRFRDDLKAWALRDANVVEATFRHEDPAVSARALNALMEIFKQKHLETFSSPKAEFMSGQLEQYRAKWEGAQDRLQAFKREHGISSLSQQRELLLKQHKDLDTSMKSIDGQRYGLMRKIEALAAQLRRVTEYISLSSESGEAERYRIMDDAKNRLLGLQLEEQQLLVKYREDSRLVQNVRREIAVVEKFVNGLEAAMEDKVTKGKNPVYEQLEKDLLASQSSLDGYEAQSAEIRRQLHSLDQQLTSLDELEKELQVLERDAAIQQDNYKMYHEKTEEAHVSEEMDRLKMANVSVIQQAEVPPKPLRPKKLLYLLIGIAVGGLGGVGTAFAAEYFQRGYTRPEHVERDLGIPVLVTVAYKE